MTAAQSALITVESDRTQCIAETAYFLAMERGFTDGDPLQDWLEAERRVFSGSLTAKQ